MSKYILAFLFGLSLCFTNCQKVLFDIPDEITHTLVFEEVWQYTKQHYCCFDIKNVDWDAVHQTYAPQVEDSMNDEQFEVVILNMLSELKDGSISFATASEIKHYEGYHTAFPTNLDEIAQNNYFSNYNYLEDSILYLANFPSLIESPTTIELIIRAEALIIDLRNVNFNVRAKTIHEQPEFLGLTDAFNIQKTIGEIRTRADWEINEYTTEEFEIGTNPSENDYSLPIIVLCNRQTFGAGSQSVFEFSQLPDCTIIGDRTGGGNLDIRSYILSNGWLLNIPKGTIFDLNGSNIGEGIDPDIFINDDPTTTDTDEIIEKALELLN